MWTDKDVLEILEDANRYYSLKSTEDFFKIMKLIEDPKRIPGVTESVSFGASKKEPLFIREYGPASEEDELTVKNFYLGLKKCLDNSGTGRPFDLEDEHFLRKGNRAGMMFHKLDMHLSEMRDESFLGIFFGGSRNYYLDFSVNFPSKSSERKGRYHAKVDIQIPGFSKIMENYCGPNVEEKIIGRR